MHGTIISYYKRLRARFAAALVFCALTFTSAYGAPHSDGIDARDIPDDSYYANQDPVSTGQADRAPNSSSQQDSLARLHRAAALAASQSIQLRTTGTLNSSEFPAAMPPPATPTLRLPPAMAPPRSTADKVVIKPPQGTAAVTARPQQTAPPLLPRSPPPRATASVALSPPREAARAISAPAEQTSSTPATAVAGIAVSGSAAASPAPVAKGLPPAQATVLLQNSLPASSIPGGMNFVSAKGRSMVLNAQSNTQPSTVPSYPSSAFAVLPATDSSSPAPVPALSDTGAPPPTPGRSFITLSGRTVALSAAKTADNGTAPVTVAPAIAVTSEAVTAKGPPSATTESTALSALAPAAGMPAAEVGGEPASQVPPVLPADLAGIKTAHSTGMLGAQPELLIPESSPAISSQSKKILDALPPEKVKKTKHKSDELEVDHERKNALDQDPDVKEHNGIGVSMRVKRQSANVNNLLESAYNALIAGNQEEAVGQYKMALEIQPNNKLALFGLATTYHRAGQLEMARPLYGRLLEIDPNNVEGLNNFLVLLADESPQAALVELGKLEESHPGFSPVPAQMAVIYEKLGDFDKAAQAMQHAIDMSPESLKYRYDMAIILDHAGRWPEAADIYQQLIGASERGAKLPAKAEEIQERLTFIRSNKPNS